MPAPIHVEIPIRAPLKEVWRRSQDPALHRRWDLRFTRIQPLPRAEGEAEQRFLYATRVGFGLEVRGEGRTRGELEGKDGARSSTLWFGSGQRRSLIREGSGFWRYEPGPEGVRFWTRYDYRVRWGRFGSAFDALLFRPFFGWATAWSFDRFRLWLERGLAPEAARRRFVAHLVARCGLALAWTWQGVVPKWIAPAQGELALASAFLDDGARAAVLALGALEVAIGIACLFLWRWPALFTAQILALPFLVAVGLAGDPRLALAPFGPVPLAAAMAALAAVALGTADGLPSARSCRRAPEERGE